MDLKDLIGRKIVDIQINDEKDALKFVFESGLPIWLSAVGDCCSSSWFENLSGVEALIGHTINEVLDREMPPDQDNTGGPEYGECIRFYGWTFVTGYGRADLEMRNSSNGYYGGSIEVGHVPLDQYNAERNPIENMKSIREDI